MSKILVIRLSSIGDIVLASPVFRCLKKQLPDAEIHLATKEAFKMVTASNPYIDHFHFFDSDLTAFIRQLKEQNFDYVVDLHNNIRSTRIRKALKKKTFVIDKQNIKKFFLTEYSLKFLKIRHITQRSLDTVAPLGVKDDGQGLDY
ncbi:MAG: glycosyltransferase family 9 protein, partial [Chitinophagaceae bacterium]